ncbi:thiamin biosynthesis protein [Ceratobasidium sp. AG-Ba]|nr:thiamin biosynthesis protein [Ceratobasidium sp. AG-Ba]
MTGKTKRRASSPAQRPGPSKVTKSDDGKPIRSLSALAPVFVPRSNPSSGQQTPTKTEAKLPSSSTQTTLTPARFTPLFKSELIEVKDSTFQARLFRLENPVAHRTKILSYMKKHYTDVQHHMAAWRCLVLKDGMTGLEGQHAFMVESGCCDDGESRGGKTVMDVLEKSGLSDVLVVVSRRFGGTLLGPVRFTHIADCARAVCTAMYEKEKAEERASKVADLVAQLREWDTEVTELRTQIALLDAKESNEKKTDNRNDKEENKPSVPILLKHPDYTSVLNPPDVEKAERLLQARRRTVQSLKSALEKKQNTELPKQVDTKDGDTS